MKTCQKCGYEYEGSFCSMCGTKDGAFITTSQNIQTETFAPYGITSVLSETPNSPEQVKTHPLLGFRSNKTWKKVISIFYMIICGIIFFSWFFESKFENLPTSDFIIEKISQLFPFAFLISPYIFISNFSFRNKLPLFKQRKSLFNVLGIFVFFITMILLSTFTDSLHSKEYHDDMQNHSYVVIKTINPTQTNQGEIHKQCSFCGRTTTEYTAPYNK